MELRKLRLCTIAEAQSLKKASCQKEAKGVETELERDKKTRTKRHPILGLVRKLIVYPEDVKVFYVER